MTSHPREARRTSPWRLPARLVTAIALCAVAAAAQAATAPAWQDLSRGDPALAKVSSHLVRAAALAADGRTAAEISRAVPLVGWRDGLAEVEVRLELQPPAGLEERLRAAGLELGTFHPRRGRAYGRIEPSRLGELAALGEVATIHPAPRPLRRVGAATSQADDTTRAVSVRVFLNHDGSGVDVGVISDSFNAGRGGAVSAGSCGCATPGSSCTTVVNGMTNQASGDLPPGIPILDDCTAGAPNCSSLIDEGAAMAESIFDLAPGAGFLFHSGFNSPADFADGIEQLVNCGAEVIVDDVGWPGQAFFQDDVIAQAAQTAVDAGVAFFSAAGNDATFGVIDAYLDASSDDNPCPETKLPPDGEDLHDFGGGDLFAAVTVPDDCSIYAELQWSETFDGDLGPGAASDLDLYLLATAADPASTGGANVLAASITDQGCGIPEASGGDPLEAVLYDNATGSPRTVYLAVDHCCGDEGVDLRLLTLSADCATTDPGWNFEDGDPGESAIFVDGQIWGHPAARGVTAVAAAFYAEIDSGGAVDLPTGQLDVEPFSSLGGDLPFYFDGSGAALPGAPQLRFKPAITAPDGTNNTFLGSDIVEDPDLDPNFFGTSAAAPHAAALAALLLDATGGNLTPRAVREVLRGGALEMESPGDDGLSGAGSADALRAVRCIDDKQAPLVDELEIDLDGGTFVKTPGTPLQPLQAIDELRLTDGDFDGVAGSAAELIFSDGFESGDTSAWTH